MLDITEMLCFIIFLTLSAASSKKITQHVQKADETATDVAKRILLESEGDLLSVISNFTAQIAHLTSEMQVLKKDIGNMQSGASSTGSTYVRWGRATCPKNGTETVYSGYAGGSYYSSSGAASNYICLSNNPLWANYTDAVDSGAKVYGVEYELDSMVSIFGINIHNDDAPCSVCRTTRSSIIMIPGRNRCYDGWTLEYSGYLVAGRAIYHATQYVCMDSSPETIIGGHANAEGALFYFVEGICGSLKCPPYVHGRELTCAVCSK